MVFFILAASSYVSLSSLTGKQFLYMGIYILNGCRTHAYPSGSLQEKEQKPEGGLTIAEKGGRQVGDLTASLSLYGEKKSAGGSIFRYAIAGFGTADYHAAETIREYDATGKIMAYGDTGRAAAKAGLETDDRLSSGHHGGAPTLLCVLAIAKCAVRLVFHPVSPRLTLFCWPSTFGLREESYWEVITSRQKGNWNLREKAPGISGDGVA